MVIRIVGGFIFASRRKSKGIQKASTKERKGWRGVGKKAERWAGRERGRGVGQGKAVGSDAVAGGGRGKRREVTDRCGWSRVEGDRSATVNKSH